MSAAVAPWPSLTVRITIVSRSMIMSFLISSESELVDSVIVSTNFASQHYTKDLAFCAKLTAPFPALLLSIHVIAFSLEGLEVQKCLIWKLHELLIVTEMEECHLRWCHDLQVFSASLHGEGGGILLFCELLSSVTTK